MKKGDLLFVYGTLRNGESADLSRNPNASFVGEDKINGKLYAVGWFPGVKTEPGHFDPGGDFVQGDVFELLDESIISTLDGYEGYPSLFNRVETETGAGRHVWVYTYNGRVSEDSRIQGGDWVRYSNTSRPSMGTAA